MCTLHHRQPKLCGSSLVFEFTRECMKINKIRPKCHFSTKIEIRMTYLEFRFCNLLCLCLQSYLEAVLSTFKFLSCTNSKKNWKAEDSEADSSSSKLYKSHENLGPNSPKLLSKDQSIICLSLQELFTVKTLKGLNRKRKG